MRYFIEDVRIYKNVNKKGSDLQKYVTPLMQYLVAIAGLTKGNSDGQAAE